MQVLDKTAKQRTEVRQAGLVDAALMLAAQRSPADITTADLAHAVGISQGAVFKHFASKEAIWLAVLDWMADTLMARLQLAAKGAENAALPALRGISRLMGESARAAAAEGIVIFTLGVGSPVALVPKLATPSFFDAEGRRLGAWPVAYRQVVNG